MQIKILIIATLLACINTQENGLIEAIKTEAKNVAASYPSNYESLIKNLQGATSMVTDSIKKTELDLLYSKYKLPSQVYDKIKGIAFSTSVAIKAFNVVVNSNSARVEEYIGAGYQQNGIVKFAYIKTIVYGSLVPKYDVVTYKKCKRIIFKFCKKKKRNVQRGNTEYEINQIKQALRAKGYSNLNEKINSINSNTQMILTENQMIASLNGSKKAMLVPQTGQVFAGKSVFSPAYLAQVKNYGKLLGVNRANQGPFNLQLKNNGNLVTTNKSGATTWTAYSGGKGTGPYRLSVTDDGELYLSDANWMPLYHSSGKYTYKNQFALIQDYRYYSDNGKYYVQIQREGDIVLYEEKRGASNDKILWNTEEFDDFTGPFSLVIEDNGNLKTIDGSGKTVWQTKKTTKVPGPHKLKVTDDGKLQVLDGKNGIVWKN